MDNERVDLKLDNLEELFNIDRLIDSSRGQFNVPHIEELVDHVQSHLEKLLIGFGKDSIQTSSQGDVNHRHNHAEIFKCPYDQNHTRISSRQRLETHSRKCRLKQLGYTRQDIRDIARSVDKPSMYQVNIDSHTMNHLFDKSTTQISSSTSYRLPIPFVPDRQTKLDERDVPKTNNYLMVNFTPQERLAMYEHSLREAKAKGFSTNLPIIFEEQTRLPATSITEPKRKWTVNDSSVKKRPRSHRKTGGSKSYTEVLRGLIQAQMDSLNSESMDLQSMDELIESRKHSKKYRTE